MTFNRFVCQPLLVCAFAYCSSAFAQSGSAACGPLENGYGPYDFRTDRDKLPIVVGAHFTPMVEQLIRGTTSGTPGGDIDYTLRAIPNHPNALLSMMRLAEKEKDPKPSGSRYTVECWFDRAIRFRPDDQVVRMIYTTYLTKNKRKPEAMQQLEIVLHGATKDNPFTHQNVGLLLVDLGEYDKALVQAHKAIELGLNRPDLRQKLQNVGKWVEPPPASEATPAATSSEAKP